MNITPNVLSALTDKEKKVIVRVITPGHSNIDACLLKTYNFYCTPLF